MRVVFFILFFAQLTYAQVDTTLLANEKGGADRFELTLKLDVTGLLNPYLSSTGIVTDIRLNKSLSLEGELGAYFFAPARTIIKTETYNGIKTRFGFKYWVNPLKRKNLYVGLQLGNKYIVNKNFRNALIQNQYIETILVKRKILAAELDFKVGLQWHLGENKRFILETYWGVGVRFNRVTIKSPRESAVLEDDFENFFDFRLPDGDSVLPSIFLLGLNVGYVIR